MKKYNYNFENTFNKLFNETFNTNHVVYGDMLCGNAKKAGGDIIQTVVSCGEKTERYPYYNIIKIDDEKWIIEIALAGFDKSSITVEEKDGYLIVSGKQPENDTNNYVHRGIALRSFKKSFKLAEWMIVCGATMNNGILSVHVELEIPEEKKPKKFDIL